MEEIELPVFESGHLAEEFKIGRFALFLMSEVLVIRERRELFFFGDDENFFSRIEEAEIFFGVFILVLIRSIVVEITVPLFDGVVDFSVLSVQVFQTLFKENVLIEGEREAKSHESHDRESDEDRQLFA